MTTQEDGSEEQQSENTCPACAGTGRRDGVACQTCGATGTVVETLGDA